MDIKSILERVTQMRKARGHSERSISLAAGLSADTIRNWRRRMNTEKDPGINMRSINAIAAALEVKPDWLLNGDGDSTNYAASEMKQLKILEPSSDLRHVSVYDIEASAGDGAVVTMDDPLYQIGFSHQMLSTITNAQNDELAVIRVRGDSMMPTLADGDMMLVDTTKRNTNYDGMFILRYDDVLRVKRIDFNPSTRKLWVKSDNPVYEPFEVERSDLDVVGRVVWISRRV
jgi:phage repressor protein C with HTH and peptisase S24 domain